MADVYWIGGSPGSGKSSVTRILTQRYGVWAYYFDFHEPDHTARESQAPERFPESSAFLSMSMDERWVLRSPEEMTRNVIAAWRERFPLVLEDLAALPADRAIVAEGAGLFPECVAPILEDPRRAIWLVPTAAFCRSVRMARRSSIFADTSDPERALENLIARDILLAQHVKRSASELGCAVFETDGTVTVEEQASLVERQFGLREHDSPAAHRQTTATEDWHGYVGHYAHEELAGCDVTYDGSQLALTLTANRLGGLLEQVDDRLFRFAGGPYVGEPVRFDADERGDACRLRMGPGVFTRRHDD